MRVDERISAAGQEDEGVSLSALFDEVECLLGKGFVSVSLAALVSLALVAGSDKGVALVVAHLVALGPVPLLSHSLPSLLAILSPDSRCALF